MSLKRNINPWKHHHNLCKNLSITSKSFLLSSLCIVILYWIVFINQNWTQYLYSTNIFIISGVFHIFVHASILSESFYLHLENFLNSIMHHRANNRFFKLLFVWKCTWFVFNMKNIYTWNIFLGWLIFCVFVLFSISFLRLPFHFL